MQNAYKLTAPDIDRLLNWFDRGHLNPSGITAELESAITLLFEILSPLAPLNPMTKRNPSGF